MKSTVFLSILSLVVIAGFTSCMTDDDNSAEATCNYVGTSDSIFYTVADDTIYSDLIQESLNAMGVIGINSLFTETAKVDYNSAFAAAMLCDQQAIETYRKKLNSLSMDKVKKSIFNAHADSLVGVGYTSSADIPLHDFSVRFLLVGGQITTSALDTDTVLFAN